MAEIEKMYFQIFVAEYFFFLSNWCTRGYEQTFAVHELKQKDKYIDKTWLIQRLVPESFS